MVRGSRWKQHATGRWKIDKIERIKVGEHLPGGFTGVGKYHGFSFFQLLDFRNCPLQLLSQSLLTLTEFFNNSIPR